MPCFEIKTHHLLPLVEFDRSSCCCCAPGRRELREAISCTWNVARRKVWGPIGPSDVQAAFWMPLGLSLPSFALLLSAPLPYFGNLRGLPVGLFRGEGEKPKHCITRTGAGKTGVICLVCLSICPSIRPSMQILEQEGEENEALHKMMASEQKASLPNLFQDKSRPCLSSWPEVGGARGVGPAASGWDWLLSGCAAVLIGCALGTREWWGGQRQAISSHSSNHSPRPSGGHQSP